MNFQTQTFIGSLARTPTLHPPDFFKKLCLLLCCLLIAADFTASAQNTVGVTFNNGGAWPGYTLFTPTSDTHAYLVDNAGQLVNRWTSAYPPGFTAYLLPDSHLLRAAQYGTSFPAGGAGGRVELLDWDSTLLWGYNYSTTQYRQNHDAIMLPNSNVLMIAWELKSNAEAVAAGRNPALLTQSVLWPSYLVEVQPVGTTNGNIVWIWDVWDHLIQDFNSTKANYGNVTNHPELVDVNFALDGTEDWLHVNGLDYNADLDEVLISVHNLSEIWIVDHGTTMAQAAGHTGRDPWPRRRPAVSLGQPGRLPRRHRGESTTVPTAQPQLDPRRFARRRPYSDLRQRRQPAGWQLLVRRGDCSAAHNQWHVHADARHRFRPVSPDVDIRSLAAVEFLRAERLQRAASYQRQYTHRQWPGGKFL